MLHEAASPPSFIIQKIHILPQCSRALPVCQLTGVISQQTLDQPPPPHHYELDWSMKRNIGTETTEGQDRDVNVVLNGCLHHAGAGPTGGRDTQANRSAKMFHKSLLEKVDQVKRDHGDNIKHVGMVLVQRVGTAEGLPPRQVLLGSCWSSAGSASEKRPGCWSWSSVTHLLWDLVGVEDTRNRHLDFVFLLLCLAQRRLSLLQEQI